MQIDGLSESEVDGQSASSVHHVTSILASTDSTSFDAFFVLPPSFVCNWDMGNGEQRLYGFAA
jgi:hypothetical protein